MGDFVVDLKLVERIRSSFQDFLGVYMGTANDKGT